MVLPHIQMLFNSGELEIPRGLLFYLRQGDAEIHLDILGAQAPLRQGDCIRI
jgi:hypothetical protein